METRKKDETCLHFMYGHPFGIYMHIWCSNLPLELPPPFFFMAFKEIEFINGNTNIEGQPRHRSFGRKVLNRTMQQHAECMHGQ